MYVTCIFNADIDIREGFEKMKKKTLITLFIAALLMTVSCANGETAETKGEKETNPAETKQVETTGEAETALPETELPETEAAETDAAETAAPFDYIANDLSSYITVGNYTGLSVTTQSDELTEEEYAAELAALLESYAEYEKITDRAVAEGETVVTSFAGYLDGVQFEGGTSASSEVTAKDGTGYIDGFGSAFIGQMPGVEFSFNVTFPESYHNADLAGKEVTFVCTVSHIYGENLIVPELTDAFVSENFGYENIAEFDAAFRDYNTEEKKYNIESEMNGDLWSQILDNSAVLGYPEGEVDRHCALIRSDMEQTAMMYGYDFAQFIQLYTGMTEEQFNETALDQAKNYVKENLIIYQIAKAENLVISEEKFNEEVDAIAAMNGVTADVIVSYYGKDSLMLSLLQEEIFKVVAASANITIEEAAAE